MPAHIGSTYPVPTHIVSVGVALALRRYRLLMSIKYVLTTHVDDYRADRAAVEMHDGAAVRSTPLLASAGGQSTATGV